MKDMADIPPLSTQHTPVNSPEPTEFRTSIKESGFPQAIMTYVTGHTVPSIIGAPVMSVKRHNQYAMLATQETTYSTPVATPNQKIGPSAATVL